MRKEQRPEPPPPRPTAPRAFCVSVARTLLKFIATDGQVDQKTGTLLKWQLGSAVQVRFGVATAIEDVGMCRYTDVLQIQQRIREAIQAIRSGKNHTLFWEQVGSIEFIEFSLSRDFNTHQLRASWLLPNERAAFWMGVVVALEQAGDLIHECAREQCHELYVRLRGQKYCSTACSQRDRSARHYDTHRDEVLDRRHAAYVKAKRQEQNHLRVQRRRRTT